MPPRSITTSFNKSISDILLLENYVNSCVGLEVRYQYMVNEVIMLRLFSIMESSFEDIALKLACGAFYKNGNSPIVLHSSSNMSDAHANMLSFNRKRSLRYLRWTKADFIEDGIRHILSVADSYNNHIQIHGSLINEMRIVRNHIAHRSTSTRIEYKALILSKYGANLNLSLGAYLISTARSPISNISYYIQASKIILHDVTKG